MVLKIFTFWRIDYKKKSGIRQFRAMIQGEDVGGQDTPLFIKKSKNGKFWFLS